MSNPEQNKDVVGQANHGEDPPARLIPEADRGGPIPLARPASGTVGSATPGASSSGGSSGGGGEGASISAKPILELAEDNCPRCGAPMDAEAVVCFKCGYDLKANVVHQPTVGVVHAADGPTNPDGTPVKEFVTPGRGDARLMMYVGAVILLMAMIAAGVFAPRTGGGGPSFLLVSGSVVLVAYLVLLHTGTGIVAVVAAARLSEERFSRVELVAGRMFVAVAVFQLLASIHWSIPVAFLAGIVRWGVAGAAYWLVIRLLFKRDQLTTSLIGLAHFALWILMGLGMALAGWVSAAGMVSGVGPAPAP